MDPASLIHESPFPAPNASSYNLADIWRFPIDGAGVGGDSGGIIGIQSGSRRSIFGQILGHSEPPSGISRNVAIEEPNAVEQSKRNGGRKRRDSASEDESAKLVSTSSGNAMNDRNEKRLKVRGSSDENWELKTEVEASSGNDNKLAEQSAQPSEAPKQDYIHVRARRGQATDSHSLAERARREKISERMKILQDLVPGCNKVIGKASVLDEIINYIQSLQCQVEFLSMKLEAVNSRMRPTIEGFPAKDNRCFQISCHLCVILHHRRSGFMSKSLVSRHLIPPAWHLDHKLPGNLSRDHSQSGCICRLALALKGQHNSGKSSLVSNKGIKPEQTLTNARELFNHHLLKDNICS